MRRFHLIARDAADPDVAELVGRGVLFAEGTTVVVWSGVSIEISRHDPDRIAATEQLEVVWLDAGQPAATVRPLRVLGDPRG